MSIYYKDRKDAGQKLAQALHIYLDRKDVLLLGLARGGVVIAAAIGQKLSLPYDLIVVSKVGAPNDPEVAIGAIAEAGQGYFNESLIHALNISQDYLECASDAKGRSIKERAARYRKNRGVPELKGSSVILVDDGIATGATMIAAVYASRAKGASEIIIAVPVAPSNVVRELELISDHLVCLCSSEHFRSVSQFYSTFPQISDEEMMREMLPS